jgi:hypothetical protein
MRVGDIFEAKSEPRFIVEVVLDREDNFFYGKVIDFPKTPKGWVMNKQEVGYIGCYSKDDFIYSVDATRDKRLIDLGI